MAAIPVIRDALVGAQVVVRDPYTGAFREGVVKTAIPHYGYLVQLGPHWVERYLDVADFLPAPR